MPRASPASSRTLAFVSGCRRAGRGRLPPRRRPPGRRPGRLGRSGLDPGRDPGRQGHVALANKETLVVAGDAGHARQHAERRRRRSSRSTASTTPSTRPCESAPPESVRRLILTASGGPFRDLVGRSGSRNATRRDALAHPTWSMGPKITVDSATMMNKGLEIIEAHHLFAVRRGRDRRRRPPPEPGPLAGGVHRRHRDRAARRSTTCGFPILYALAWPERLPTPLPALDLRPSTGADLRAARPAPFPGRSGWRGRRSTRVARCRPCSTQPTRWRCDAFLDRALLLRRIIDTVEPPSWSHGSRRNRALATLEQALAADRRGAPAWPSSVWGMRCPVDGGSKLG